MLSRWRWSFWLARHTQSAANTCSQNGGVLSLSFLHTFRACTLQEPSGRLSRRALGPCFGQWLLQMRCVQLLNSMLTYQSKGCKRHMNSASSRHKSRLVTWCLMAAHWYKRVELHTLVRVEHRGYQASNNLQRVSSSKVRPGCSCQTHAIRIATLADLVQRTLGFNCNPAPHKAGTRKSRMAGTR